MEKYSPSKQLLRYNLQRAWSEGREVDFSSGNLDYKEKLSDAIEPVQAPLGKENHPGRLAFGYLD